MWLLHVTGGDFFLACTLQSIYGTSHKSSLDDFYIGSVGSTVSLQQEDPTVMGKGSHHVCMGLQNVWF